MRREHYAGNDFRRAITHRGPAPYRKAQAAGVQLRVRRGRRGGRGGPAPQPRRVRAHHLAAAHARRRRVAGPDDHDLRPDLPPAGHHRADRLQRPALAAGRPRARPRGGLCGHPVHAQHRFQLLAGQNEGRGGRAALVPALSGQGSEGDRPARRSRAGIGLRSARGDDRRAGLRRAGVGPAQLFGADAAQPVAQARRPRAPALAVAGDGAARRPALREPRRVPAAGQPVRAGRRQVHGHADQRQALLGRHGAAAGALEGQAGAEGHPLRRGRAPRGRCRCRRHRAEQPRWTAARFLRLGRGTAARGGERGRRPPHGAGRRRIPPGRRRAEGDGTRSARRDDRTARRCTASRPEARPA